MYTNCSIFHVRLYRESAGTEFLAILLASLLVILVILSSLYITNNIRDRRMAAAVELQKQQKYILVLANHKAGSRFRKHVQELVDYLKEFVQLNYNVVYIGDRTCRGPQPTDDPVVWWNSIINDKEILQNHIILVVVGPERFSETALASLAASPPKFVHNNPVELQLMGLQPTNPGGRVPI